MNSTLIKIAIAYVAGIITYALYQNYEEAKPLNKDTSLISDTTEIDLGSIPGCACVDSLRYNVRPEEESGNIACTVDACKLMVNGSTPTVPGTPVDTITKKGAWFSKKTLDLMFCHAPDANGIFVYKALMPGSTKEQVYIVEAARTNKIKIDDDRTSIIYYSRTLCPNICGKCGE